MTDLYDNLLRIAKIIGTHSTKGRLKIYRVTDNLKRFSEGNEVYLKSEKSCSKVKITEFKEYKKKICLLKLEGINNINDAESIKGFEIYIDKALAEKTRIDLEKESYYYYELIGCDVYLRNRKFGVILEIIEAGAGEIIIIKDESGREYMIPFVESMVDTMHINEKRIDINPVEGLLDF